MLIVQQNQLVSFECYEIDEDLNSLMKVITFKFRYILLYHIQFCINSCIS